MIKSSDKKFNNTYRLLKVLANKDYLAIDLSQNFFLFCAASKMPSNSSIQKDKKYLLKHRECIMIDNLKYYVFEVGENPPVWAKNMDRKIISQEINVFLMFRHAVGNILNYMLWYDKPKQAREWLDVRNCWFIDGQLYLLILPRALKPSLGVRRSEVRHSSLDSSSASEIFECQSSLLRDFGLMMWEIIEQKPYSNGDAGSCSCKQVSKLLLEMIYKQTRFEDVQSELTDCPQIQPRSKLKHKSRFSTVNTLSYDKRKSSLQSVQLTKQVRSLKQSRFANIYTQVVNRKYQSPQSSKKLQKGQSDYINRPIKRPSQSKLQNPRSMSVQSEGSLQSNQKKIEFRKSRYTLKSRLSTNNTQQTTKYQWWLKNKKYSFNIEQKIKKQEATAQQKFNRSIDHKEEESPSPYDEEKLKLRLLSKVIKFRDRSKSIVDSQNRSNTQQDQELNESFQKKSTLIDFSGCKRIGTNFIMNRWKETSTEKLTETEEKKSSPQLDKSRKFVIQKVNNYMIRRSNILNVNVTTVQAGQPIPEKEPQSKTVELTHNNIKIQNEYYQPKKQPAQKINQIVDQIEATKRKEVKIQEQKEQKPIKIEKVNKKEQIVSLPRKKIRQNVISSEDHQFQEINLQQINKIKDEKKPVVISEPKKQTLSVSKSRNEKSAVKIPQSHKTIKVSVEALIHQFITLINVLGDITVKTVKIKDKIQAVEWRKGIYYIYQRFQYERNKLLIGLKEKTRSTVRSGNHVDNKQWEQWEKSQTRIQLIEKIAAQNITIQQTLKRFAQKVLQECKLDRKIQYYIKNRDRFQTENDKKIRFQLSKQAVSSIVDEFDSVIQKRINTRDVVNHILDGLFGLSILRELDGLSSKNPVKLQDYKQYKYDLRAVTQQADELYYLYFPEEKEKAAT